MSDGCKHRELVSTCDDRGLWTTVCRDCGRDYHDIERELNEYRPRAPRRRSVRQRELDRPL